MLAYFHALTVIFLRFETSTKIEAYKIESSVFHFVVKHMHNRVVLLAFQLPEDEVVSGCPLHFPPRSTSSLSHMLLYFIGPRPHLVFSTTCRLPTVIGLLSPWITPIIETWCNLHILICFSSGNSVLRNGNKQKILEVFRHVKPCKRLVLHTAWCIPA